MATITLAMEQSPDAGSECPMLDFTDPSNNGVFRSLQNSSAMAFTSWGSPTYVLFTYTIKNTLKKIYDVF